MNMMKKTILWIIYMRFIFCSSTSASTTAVTCAVRLLATCSACRSTSDERALAPTFRRSLLSPQPTVFSSQSWRTAAGRDSDDATRCQSATIECAAACTAATMQACVADCRATQPQTHRHTDTCARFQRKPALSISRAANLRAPRRIVLAQSVRASSIGL